MDGGDEGGDMPRERNKMDSESGGDANVNIIRRATRKTREKRHELQNRAQSKGAPWVQETAISIW